MSHPAQIRDIAASLPTLGLYSPPLLDGYVGRWKINGYRATIVIWTAAEWDDLPFRPTDAQFFPCGVWCALRME